MNNIVLLVPESVCETLRDLAGVTVQPLPSTSGGQLAWPSLSVMQKLAETFPCTATSACSDAAIVREMLGLLPAELHHLSTAIVFSDEPLPSELRTSLPEILHPLLRRPQPRDLALASADALAPTHADSFMDVVLNPGMSSMALSRYPAIDRFPLTSPGIESLHARSCTLQSAISSAVNSPQLDKLDHQCLEAGLLLLWDFLDESHQISQSMEGKGSPRTGDYWHGIMHRREPDAGNAAYWFRRVGRHPALERLGIRLIERMSQLGASEPQRTLVRNTLLSGGAFDPFAMIQLSERALAEPGSREDVTFRMVQYLEMLNLLSWSCGG